MEFKKQYLSLGHFRSKNGPIEPNRYWQRAPRKRCQVCGRRIRGKNHDLGHTRR